MPLKVTIWLSDAEGEELKSRARGKEMKPHEITTLVMGKWLGADVGDSIEDQKIWALEHEIETRMEYETRGGTTEDRIRKLLEEDGPMTIREIMEGLGWKRTGSLHEMVRELCVEVPMPKKERKRRKKEKIRGAVPRYWEWAG